jgi:metallophosphoesterase superfamily enzyme
MVKIHIGEQQTRALCDSGAEITCINEHFSNSTQFDASSLQKYSVVSIVRAGDSKHTVKGQIRLSIR